MTFKINAYFNIEAPSKIIRELGLQKGGKVQRYTDTAVVRHCDKYVPMRTGILKKANGTVYGSGKVKYNTPYAAENYYRNKGRGSGGTAYGGFRGRLWFERMKAAMGNALAESVRYAANAAGAIWRG
ncbi:MAG: minor capsid protein [Prevotella sp.]|nr:minor capsid protein [Prevotella sp.]